MPRTQPLGRLFKSLASHIGHSNARLELKWLQQAFTRPIAPLLKRRLAGEPLQYILGTQPFGPLNLLVRPPILIPRPETEDWTIRLARHVSPTPHPLSLLDLCTGSGCIPLLLCHLWPEGSVRAHAVDVNPDAIQLAVDNAAQCGITTLEDPSSASSHILSRNIFSPFQADILDPKFIDTLHGRAPFHLITSNPPYVSDREYDLLPLSVKNFEDPRALLGDHTLSASSQRNSDGLSFYHAIARLLRHPNILTPDGLVVLEVGAGQARNVQRIMQSEAGLRSEVWLDPWGKQRVILASR